MTLSGTESGVEALSDRDLQQYEPYTTRAWATLLPPTAMSFVVVFVERSVPAMPSGVWCTASRVHCILRTCGPGAARA